MLPSSFIIYTLIKYRQNTVKLLGNYKEIKLLFSCVYFLAVKTAWSLSFLLFVVFFIQKCIFVSPHFFNHFTWNSLSLWGFTNVKLVHVIFWCWKRIYVSLQYDLFTVNSRTRSEYFTKIHKICFDCYQWKCRCCCAFLSQIMPQCDWLSSVVYHVLPMLTSQSALLRTKSNTSNSVSFTTWRHKIDLFEIEKKSRIQLVIEIQNRNLI